MGTTGRLLAFASALAVARAAVDNITLSKTPPSGSQNLDRALVSFSLEQDRWTDWVGTTSVNQVIDWPFINTTLSLTKPPSSGSTPWTTCAPGPVHRL
jgi:hypothetical protein